LAKRYGDLYRHFHLFAKLAQISIPALIQPDHGAESRHRDDGIPPWFIYTQVDKVGVSWARQQPAEVKPPLQFGLVANTQRMDKPLAQWQTANMQRSTD